MPEVISKAVCTLRRKEPAMNKIPRTWWLMSECWEILKQDKRLLMFPLISVICCLLLLASFAIPLYATGVWHPDATGGWPLGAMDAWPPSPGQHPSAAQQVAYYGVLFVFYICNYFIITFFNAAIIGCTATRLRGGGRPTLTEAIRMAAARLHVIFAWSLLSATFGMILRVIEDRSNAAGEIAASLIGIAWTVMSFFVVPILALENKGPIKAMQESTSLVKQTWGKQLVGNFSFGLIFLLLAIPAVVAVVLAFAMGGAVAGNIALVAAAIYMIVLGVVQSALQSIFQTILYVYAHGGEVPYGFNPSNAWS